MIKIAKAVSISGRLIIVEIDNFFFGKSFEKAINDLGLDLEIGHRVYYDEGLERIVGIVKCKDEGVV